jgi:hypothetical protein
MKRMESPSTVEVVVATTRVVPEVTAMTTTGMRAVGTTVHCAQIPSLYLCLHRQAITKKKTRGLSRAARLCRLPPGRSSSSAIESPL